MYAAIANPIDTLSDIDKRGFFTTANMIIQWRFSFFVRCPFLENLRLFVPFPRDPRTLPTDIHTLIHEGPSEVHVIKQHVWSRGISGVYDFIVDVDNGCTQSARDGAPEGELGPERLRLFDYPGESHVQSARGGVGLDNGFDSCGNAAVLAMQASVAGCIGLGSADVVE